MMLTLIRSESQRGIPCCLSPTIGCRAARNRLHLFAACALAIALAALPCIARAAGAPAEAGAPTTAPVNGRMQVAEGVWDGADRDDVQAVLQSAGEALREACPRWTPPPIRVAHGGPITLFERDKDGAVVIRLDAGGAYWSQYAYQFAHEFCHVLCGASEKDRGSLWMEESLCEAASLFALRKMSETWKTDPPHPNWKPYAPHLAAYARERMERAALPRGQTLAQWYAANADALRRNGEDRARCGVVAAALLPRFEAAPRHWAALAKLDDEQFRKPLGVGDFLQTWHDLADEEDRPFLRKLAGDFGVELTAVK